MVPEFELLLERLSSFYRKLLTQTILLAMIIYIFTVFGCREFRENYKGMCQRRCKFPIAIHIPTCVSILAYLRLLLFSSFFFPSSLFSSHDAAHAKRFPDGELPRWNFTDIFHSFMIVFRSLCGEWFETFTDCFLVNGHIALIYYVALVIVGGFTVSIEPPPCEPLNRHIWNVQCTGRPTQKNQKNFFKKKQQKRKSTID